MRDILIMNLTLHVWRQKNKEDAGHMETYPARDVSPDMSFLEMLDVVNQGLIKDGKEPIAFDSDCREGICGTCSLDGQWHAAWAGEWHDRLPVAHAQVRRRRKHHD